MPPKGLRRRIRGDIKSLLTRVTPCVLRHSSPSPMHLTRAFSSAIGSAPSRFSHRQLLSSVLPSLETADAAAIAVPYRHEGMPCWRERAAALFHATSQQLVAFAKLTAAKFAHRAIFDIAAADQTVYDGRAPCRTPASAPFGR